MRLFLPGDISSDTVLLQPVAEAETGSLEFELSEIIRLSGRTDICLAAVVTDDWDLELSPWTAPPVFGKRPFGGGAEKTLGFITDEVIPQLAESRKRPPILYIGGYSLAGLFALWASYKTDLFIGAAAVSPSVWFPGFTSFVRENPLRAKKVYLSLGDREEKAKNPVMARVGDSIREIDALYTGQGIPHVLEWNEGNHFRDPELRTAKGFAWLLRASS